MQLSTRLARLIFIATACILLILSFILYAQVKDLLTSYNQVNEATVVNLKLEQELIKLDIERMIGTSLESVFK